MVLKLLACLRYSPVILQKQTGVQGCGVIAGTFCPESKPPDILLRVGAGVDKNKATPAPVSRHVYDSIFYSIQLSIRKF